AQVGLPQGYRCEFTAIPAEVVFRPQRITPKPRMAGVLQAKVCAQSVEEPHLDQQGRYHVQLLADRAGQGSHWLRMAQPYSGPRYGVHLPLHQGAEVLVTFEDGDIDRPVIAAAVPNAVAESPVSSRNAREPSLITQAGNHLVFNDLAGSERLV